MKAKGIVSITVGILGAIFVCMFDVIAGKPVNDITGPISIFTLILCGLLIIIGIWSLCRPKVKE